MKVPNFIDHYIRRRGMNMLTRHIGKTSKKQKLTSLEINDISKILVVRPNHRLGNMVLNTPLIQELHSTFPNARIDVLAKGGLAPIILKNYNVVNNFILLPKKPFSNLFRYVAIWFKMSFKRYDLIVNAVKGSSSGKLLTSITSAKYKVYQNPEDDINNKNTIHNAKEAICAFRTVFSGNGIKTNNLDIPLLDLKLSETEINLGKETLNNLVDSSKETIVIFTYATAGKCYSKLWWSVFYEELKKRFPEYNILEILPMENVSQINFKAISYYSKDIREMGAVMANSSIFIGADCGVTHLASASGVPTIGLFKGRIDVYKPYGNQNKVIDTANSSLQDWMSMISEILVSRQIMEKYSQKNKKSSVHLTHDH